MMRAILVSVDYADLLSVSLYYNRHHFESVTVVTAPGSDDGRVAREAGADVFETNSFKDDGAVFNKWKALEQGLDAMGREGWLCIMDADVLWPKSITVWENDDETRLRFGVDGVDGISDMGIGQLCTPKRRMCEDLGYGIPDEITWDNFPLHRQQQEFAGYSQIFHASDLHLGPPPWHQVDWRHAGGADSFFQAKWPDSAKVRPPFEVLHLGPAGQNWWGRATPYLDGTVPEDAATKAELTRRIWAGRAERRSQGLDPFEPERTGCPVRTK
jgi:hypothetical protein